MNLFKIKKIICFIHIFVFIIKYQVISIAVNMTAVGSFSRFRFRVLAHFSQYNRVSPSKNPMVQRWSVLTKDSLGADGVSQTDGQNENYENSI